MTDSSFDVPWLPPGSTMLLPGRGEVFYRHHRHADPAAPTLLLLHGWTASADLQFFTAYEALAAEFSFVAIDHRGHGRGLRSDRPFELHDVADDAALLLEQLGLRDVITVGYSMGGPVSLLLARRHPGLVRGLVVEATALEWRATRRERFMWRTVHILGPLVRARATPRSMRWGIHRLFGAEHTLERFVPWIASELRRNDSHNIVQAGQSLSRFDARPFASSLGLPAGMLITTHDRLVRPRKQRALAAALGATVIELADDHLTSWTSSAEFSDATVRLAHQVAAVSVPGSSPA